MRVAATTVIRHVGVHESSGRLLVLDVDESSVRVVNEVRLPESPFRARDRNPRGGTRGLRAVAAAGSRGIVVADCSRIMTLDDTLTVVSEITHPLLGMVHAILPDETGVWVASSSADALVRLAWNGDLQHVLRITDLPGLAVSLGLVLPDPLDAGPFDDPSLLAHRVHDVAHPNAIHAHEGRLLVSLGQALCRPDGPTVAPVLDRDGNWIRPAGEWETRHVILEVREDGSGPPTVLWQQPVSGAPNHDLHVAQNRIWFNDSGARAVVGIRGADDVVRIVVDGDFVRGMVPLGDDRLLVGTQSPLRLHCVDIAERLVVFAHDLGGDPRESITCLARLPEGAVAQ